MFGKIILLFEKNIVIKINSKVAFNKSGFDNKKIE